MMHSSLKGNPQTIEELYDAPMDINDAASMMRKSVSKNERPYVRDVLVYNNRLVDRWKAEILTKIATDGKVAATKVMASWNVFEEGINICKLMAHPEEVIFPPEEIVMLWKDRFERETMAELVEHGVATVGYAWQLVLSYIRHWYAVRKYDRVYSKSDKPLDWYHDAGRHRALFNGDEHPFWTPEVKKDVEEKIKSLLSNRVEPSKSG